MSEFVLEQADAPGVYLVGVMEPDVPGDKPLARVSDYLPFAVSFPSREAAERLAQAAPGRWIVRDEATIPPRIIK